MFDPGKKPSGPVIRIRGARQHNLKNLSLDLPKNQLVVITGVSGSGKSSLAFETLYAEGQRRYVQSLSVYARQFIDQLKKPEVDFIEGLTPAIAVEQRFHGGNPRSTVATVTEIYDYLRVLYASIGLAHDPQTGEVIRAMTPTEMVDEVRRWPFSTRLTLLAPVLDQVKGDHRALLDRLRREGFIRARINGEMVELEESLKLPRSIPQTIEAVIDRLVLREDSQNRLADSIETALAKSGARREIRCVAELPSEGERVIVEKSFSARARNPVTGFELPELTPQHFSFNSHLGACPHCEGLGSLLGVDPELIIPDRDKTLHPEDDGIKLSWVRSKAVRAVLQKEISALRQHHGLNETMVLKEVPESFFKELFEGTGDRSIEVNLKIHTGKKILSRPFEGLIPMAQRMYQQSESELTRVAIRRIMSASTCPHCHGARLKPEILSVTLTSTSSVARELNIRDFTALSLDEADAWLSQLVLTETQGALVGDLVSEIIKRMHFLRHVGLGYLTLDRAVSTLSGGEHQRVRLATQIGGGLSGVLYVLDEPSIGLHQSDNEKLLQTLRHLKDLGNTVVVVEHDEDTLRQADWVIELGPGAGPRGGELMAQGTPHDLMGMTESVTGAWLVGKRRISIPNSRDMGKSDSTASSQEGDLFHSSSSEKDALDRKDWVIIRGAREHNLKNITVRFPLGALTCVTGVSGSGKSTLIDDILRREIGRRFFRAKQKPGDHDSIEGLELFDKAIVIDQDPIGRGPRSNPATYLGIFTEIRTLFAGLPLSRLRGYGAGRFSFNVPGGRCARCEGDGTLKLDLQFLPDAQVPCEECHGKRYNRETLEVTWNGRNIAEVLDMAVEEASRFFRSIPSLSQKLRPLEELGLGYLKLGQSSDTLSGGESQRIKLALELAKKSTGRTLYLLDEPTTGLHFEDVHRLLEMLLRLKKAGNTLVIIEHHLDVIKCADWILDLGPGGGRHGGNLVAQGTVKHITETPESLTGQWLLKLGKYSP